MVLEKTMNFEETDQYARTIKSPDLMQQNLERIFSTFQKVGEDQLLEMLDDFNAGELDEDERLFLMNVGQQLGAQSKQNIDNVIPAKNGGFYLSVLGEDGNSNPITKGRRRNTDDPDGADEVALFNEESSAHGMAAGAEIISAYLQFGPEAVIESAMQISSQSAGERK